MRQPGEPSVEDILESIKQVMARDNRASALNDRRRRDDASYAWDSGSIVLSAAMADTPAAEEGMAESVVPLERLDSGVDAPAEASGAQAAAGEVLDLGGDAPAPASQAPAAPAADQPETASASASSPGPLVRPEAQASMRESLATLASLANVGMASGDTVRGTSLEGMIRELLRPMLADWLDRNLPPLVERMVAEEIARIVGKQL